MWFIPGFKKFLCESSFEAGEGMTRQRRGMGMAGSHDRMQMRQALVEPMSASARPRSAKVLDRGHDGRADELAAFRARQFQLLLPVDDRSGLEQHAGIRVLRSTINWL